MEQPIILVASLTENEHYEIEIGKLGYVKIIRNGDKTEIKVYSEKRLEGQNDPEIVCVGEMEIPDWVLITPEAAECF